MAGKVGQQDRKNLGPVQPHKDTHVQQAVPLGCTVRARTDTKLVP